ncbi:YIP1 family protein [Caldicellulosiruptor morganii]|uniref:YIP1 family protein n=1 Tax=Caldicellulosiruptor morganii TaxID=1387555 RepID=A0ABY7BQZ7_9FIRM|nr:YIP1 family protein [Caldicellulosiruptor morganii]WAM34955.1 YIP1 family protein [Caldicellulosiruptor morganii]
MTNCPYCGKELQEGEICTCRETQTTVSQTGNQASDGEVINDKQNVENVNEDIKKQNGEQTENASEKKERNLEITLKINQGINIAFRYCYITVKFAWAFLKSPFDFISKIIQNNDYKAGILFAILASLFVSLQNIVLAGKGIKLVEDFIGASGLLSSTFEEFSFRAFLYNFIVLFLLYLLYCGIIKVAFTILKEKIDFKAILGAIGVSLIPIVLVGVINLLLQFISIWLVLLLSFFGIFVNTILNFWAIRNLLKDKDRYKDKDTNALYLTAITYIVGIIVVAIIIFALAGGVANSGGTGTASFNTNSIVGTWSDDHDTITFKPDGTFKANYYWAGGNWEIDGDKLYITGFLTGKEGYYYKIKGNKLILEPIPGSGRGNYEFYRVR